MYRASTDHKFILAAEDKVTNPLNRWPSHGIGKVLMNYVFCKHRSLNYSLFDEDQTFYEVSCDIFIKIRH